MITSCCIHFGIVKIEEHIVSGICRFSNRALVIYRMYSLVLIVQSSPWKHLITAASEADVNLATQIQNTFIHDTNTSSQIQVHIESVVPSRPYPTLTSSELSVPDVLLRFLLITLQTFQV